MRNPDAAMNEYRIAASAPRQAAEYRVNAIAIIIRTRGGKREAGRVYQKFFEAVVIGAESVRRARHFGIAIHSRLKSPTEQSSRGNAHENVVSLQRTPRGHSADPARSAGDGRRGSGSNRGSGKGVCRGAAGPADLGSPRLGRLDLPRSRRNARAHPAVYEPLRVARRHGEADAGRA